MGSPRGSPSGTDVRGVDDRVKPHNVDLDVIPFAESMPEATQLVDRSVSREDDAAYAGYGHRALLDELDVRSVPAWNGAVKGLQAAFENGLDGTV